MNWKTTSVLAWVLILTFGVAGMAQDAEIRGPILGEILDENTMSVRPLIGIPGAASLAAGLELGFPVEHFSMTGKGILVVHGDSGAVLLTRLNEELEYETLAVPPRPDRIFMSPGKNAAGFYYSEEQRFEVVTGLLSRNYSTVTVDLAGTFPTPEAFAVSDGGELAVLAAGDLYFVDRSGPRFLFHVSEGSLVSFARGTRDVIVADRPRGDVIAVRSSGSDVSVERVAVSEGLSDAVALSSPDADHAVIAQASGWIIDVDFATSHTTATPCDCQPTRVEGLLDDSAFLLTGSNGRSPVYLYDRSRERPRVVVVPRPGA